MVVSVVIILFAISGDYYRSLKLEALFIVEDITLASVFCSFILR